MPALSRAASRVFSFWNQAMRDLLDTFIARGDLAHLALLLWATAASFALWFALRELAAASRRFDDFVRELQSFNRRCDHSLGRPPRGRGEGS
uniref:Uncharacterized protein n=1 Tax=Rhodopseudomonas palustris (strain BisA53) TaxID=316055 RepID=Q07QD9_RHOP5